MQVHAIAYYVFIALIFFRYLDTGPTYNLGHRSVETRSTQFGSTVVIKCGVELSPPVSYTWSKQGDKLPIRARISDVSYHFKAYHYNVAF